MRTLLLSLALLGLLLLACIPSSPGDGPQSIASQSMRPTSTSIRPTTAAPPPTESTHTVVDLYGGHTYQTHGYYHVVGEMFNPTDDWLEYVKIIATFYDSNGDMIGSDFTYTELDTIPPHDRGVFDLSVDTATLGGEVNFYYLQVEGRETFDIPYQELMGEVTNEYESYGYWHLEGLVRNIGSSNCEYVKVIAAFYDAADRIVGVDFTYTELDEVEAGNQSPFDLSTDNLPEWDHFRIWVQGTPIT